MVRLLPLTLAGAVLWSAGATLPAHADPPNTPFAAHKFGEIRGRVTYCAPGGASGAIVHLPGKSFQARLGPTGEFTLYWVPVGRHSLAIDAPGRATHTIEGVVVRDWRVTDLQAIAVCRDSDHDSANEDVDCNDNNPNIRPGVPESCDGYDNNCNGAVDEGCVTCTDADHDGFFAQANCGGAVDCDDAHATTRPGAVEVCDAVDNDCDGATDEVFDLQADPSNCGACGTVCAIRGPGLAAACSAGACLPPVVQPAPEVCDFVDNDLDGLIDEGFNVGAACQGGCVDPEDPLHHPLGFRDCRPDGLSTTCECP